MADVAALTTLIEPEAEALGFALVRVRLFGSGEDRTLQIMAERPDTRQLTIDDCSALSRRVSDVLDALEAEGRDPIDGTYRLEVSSPGIDRPLTRFQDFEDWKGHEARITLATPRDRQKQFKGVLIGTDKGVSITLETPDGFVNFFSLAEIADAKLVLTDRLIAATAPLNAEGADELEDDGQDEPAEDAAAEEMH